MNHRLWILVVAGCAAQSSKPLPDQITPPGPPPPSHAWKGGAETVGSYVVTPQAIQLDGGSLEVSVAIQGEGLAQISGSEIELQVATSAGALQCHQPGPPALFEPQQVGAPSATPMPPMLVVRFDCDASIEGHADLDLQLQGAHARFAMELRPS